MEDIQDSLSNFQILRLKLRFRFCQMGIMPVYKGAMLHGLMGQGLMSVDSRLYQALYTQHDSQQPKAYSLVCNDICEKAHTGYVFSFELRLFGDAIRCVHALIESLQLAAHQFGVGPQRAKADLISLSSICNHRELTGIHPFSLVEPWRGKYAASQECALDLVSPLRLKYHGRRLQNAPSLTILVDSIARRFNALCQYWYKESPDLARFIKQSLPRFHFVETIDHTYWQEWERYSKNSRKLCQFGGLQGMISYQGDIAAALPWLELGQWLQIGNKTTFGLGDYQLITPEPLC